MAKGKVPTRDELLAFIRDSATRSASARSPVPASLKGDQRIELKQLLRELRYSGEIAADRAKTFRDPQALSDVAVLEIVRVDNDGHLLSARRHDEEKDGPPPRIEIAPQSTRSGPAPAVGDRVLAQPKRRGKNPTRRASSAAWAAGPTRSSALTGARAGGMGLVTRPTASSGKASRSGQPKRTAPCRATSSWIEATGGALVAARAACSSASGR